MLNGGSPKDTILVFDVDPQLPAAECVACLSMHLRERFHVDVIDAARAGRLQRIHAAGWPRGDGCGRYRAGPWR